LHDEDFSFLVYLIAQMLPIEDRLAVNKNCHVASDSALIIEDVSAQSRV
jgi:hypothetical protein